MEHLDLETVLSLALRGERSAHFDVCCFCREQYALALDYLAFEAKMVADENADDLQPYGDSNQQYRLAAETGLDTTPLFRLRRTWYLRNSSIILRVIEDTQKQILIGFFIAERPEEQGMRIRFDGIREEFIPDSNGVFEIGIASIDIEPMSVTLLPS